MAKKKDPDNVDDLNRLWVNIPRLRLELASLAKEKNEFYPLGELILLIRKIVREESE